VNIQTRARKLSSLTSWPYQKAHQAIVALGTQARDLARENNWPLDRAEAYLIDANLDPEYREVRDRYMSILRCDNCDRGFFQGMDKKGMTTSGSDKYCPACREKYGVWVCEECGEESLGEAPETGICQDCWDYKMSKD